VQQLRKQQAAAGAAAAKQLHEQQQEVQSLQEQLWDANEKLRGMAAAAAAAASGPAQQQRPQQQQQHASPSPAEHQQQPQPSSKPPSAAGVAPEAADGSAELQAGSGGERSGGSLNADQQAGMGCCITVDVEPRFAGHSSNLWPAGPSAASCLTVLCRPACLPALPARPACLPACRR
jgi:hypothetical protein